jgi:hypothetical protein
MMDKTQNNRMVLLLIAGIPLTMILAATWLWYFVARGELDLVGTLGTANRGELVQPPRQIDDVVMFDGQDTPLPYRSLDPRWTLVIPGAGGACDSDCENTLYITRQIHVAMGKEFNRIRRIYLSETPRRRTARGLRRVPANRTPRNDGCAPGRRRTGNAFSRVPGEPADLVPGRSCRLDHDVLQ